MFVCKNVANLNRFLANYGIIREENYQSLIVKCLDASYFEQKLKIIVILTFISTCLYSYLSLFLVVTLERGNFGNIPSCAV